MRLDTSVVGLGNQVGHQDGAIAAAVLLTVPLYMLVQCEKIFSWTIRKYAFKTQVYSSSSNRKQDSWHLRAEWIPLLPGDSS